MKLIGSSAMGNAYYWCILLCWLTVNGFLLWHNGIIVDGEGEKYVKQAEIFMATGNLSTPNLWFYFTQILLISISKACSLGLYGVIAVQLLFNLLATLAFYRLTANIFLKKTALLATVLFLANYPMQRFNTYLHTESLFYSFSFIFTAYLLQIKNLSGKQILIVVAGLTIISITRPTGLLLVPPAGLFLFFRFFANISYRKKLFAIGSVIAIFLYLLNLAIGSGGELDFMLPFRDEHIICGVPTAQHFVDIRTTDNPNSLYGLFYYITHNFSQFINLAYRRSIAFFGLMRTYYSSVHNVFLALIYYPVYVMVLWSIRYWIKKLPWHLLYFITIILLTWATVMLSCDDWHNRFFMTISPFIFILALPKIDALFAQNAANETNGNIQ